MDGERDKSDPKGIKYSCVDDMGLIDPDVRLKSLSNRGGAVEMDHNTPLRRYKNQTLSESISLLLINRNTTESNAPITNSMEL